MRVILFYATVEQMLDQVIQEHSLNVCVNMITKSLLDRQLSVDLRCRIDGCPVDLTGIKVRRDKNVTVYLF